MTDQVASLVNRNTSGHFAGIMIVALWVGTWKEIREERRPWFLAGNSRVYCSPIVTLSFQIYRQWLILRDFGWSAFRHVKVKTQISEIKFQDPEVLYLIMWLASHVNPGPSNYSTFLFEDLRSQNNKNNCNFMSSDGMPISRWPMVVCVNLCTYIVPILLCCNLVALSSRFIDTWMKYVLDSSKIAPQILPNLGCGFVQCDFKHIHCLQHLYAFN